MIDQRARSAVIPTLGLPAAHDTTGDGGQGVGDTQVGNAAVPIPPTDTEAGHGSSDTQGRDASLVASTSARNGQRTDDAHAGVADLALPDQPMEPASNGHRAGDTQDADVDLAELHRLIGHYARQLWDVQASRISAGNRLAAMERDGLSHMAEPSRAVIREYEAIERGIDRALTQAVKKHFMAPWIIEQRGIGLPGFARLLGVTGPLDRFATVSKLWKYLGLHVVDGHAPRREKGVPWTHTDCQGAHLLTCKPDCTTDHHPNCVPGGIGTAYSPQGRVVCHQIGEAIVKVGAGGSYRAAYDRKKQQYEAEREDWSQARRHNAAMRYAVKELIKAMWCEWQVRRPISK